MKIFLYILGFLLSITISVVNTFALTSTRTEEEMLWDIHFEVGNCEIPIWRSSCTSKNGATLTHPDLYKSYDLYNKTTQILSSNVLLVSNNYVFNPTFPHSALELKYGENILQLRTSSSREVIITTTSAKAICIQWSEWDGQICREKPPVTWWGSWTLSIKCTQSEYFVWDTISCQATGLTGNGRCWMEWSYSKKSNSCNKNGWLEENGVITYNSIVEEKDVWVSYFYVQKEPWSIFINSKITFSPKKKDPPISTPTPPKKDRN